jgi:hypothetical protein
MRNSRISYLISFLLVVIPINIYLIGDGVGIGIQSSILNYKITYLGTSLTSEFNEVNYVMSGLLQGRSAISSLVWFLGFLLLFAALITVLLRNFRENDELYQESGYLFIIAGMSFLLSCFVQYGILLSGPAGISIPIGVPLIVYFGWWYHQYTGESEENLSRNSEDLIDEE